MTRGRNVSAASPTTEYDYVLSTDGLGLHGGEAGDAEVQRT